MGENYVPNLIHSKLDIVIAKKNIRAYEILSLRDPKV